MLQAHGKGGVKTAENCVDLFGAGDARASLVKHESNWSNVETNGQTYKQEVKDGGERSNIRQLVKTKGSGQTVGNWSKMEVNGQTWIQMVKRGEKLSNMETNGQTWRQMVKHGDKWSNMRAAACARVKMVSVGGTLVH